MPIDTFFDGKENGIMGKNLCLELTDTNTKRDSQGNFPFYVSKYC